MNPSTLIEIIIAVFVVFIFIKFIVSPILKIILGIIIFIFLIYLLQRFFGIGADKILAPLGISFNPNWGSDFNWLPTTINYCWDQAKNFLTQLFK